MDRATYLDTLVPLAIWLIAVVHDEGPDATTAVLDAVHALPAPDDLDPMTALAITLAAIADPNRGTETALGWVRDLDPGTPPATAADERASLFVELALAGRVPARSLADAEGAETVRQLMQRGWPINEIRAHLDDPEGLYVKPWADREYAARQRARKNGAAA